MYDFVYEPLPHLDYLAAQTITRRMQDWELGVWSPSLRQLEVLRYLSAGMRHKQIASLMGVSQKTVETHLEDIRKKSKTKTMVQAVIYCHRLGIL